ncbi:MAG: Spy/CpxP family protein refolding chaperone [Bryobacterales bacterium]|nr:Spy/CpxP family protein refolding chaperone [Bryobacterales bacterium]
MNTNKMNTKRNWLIAAGALLLASTLTFAQGPGRPGFGGGPGGGPGMGMGPGGHGGRGGMLGPMAGAALGLTDAQKTQIQEIHTATQAANAPYLEQMKPLRDTELAAIKAGKSEIELKNLAQGMAVLTANIHANHLIAQAKIWKLLTPEQQAKADQLRQNMRDHFEQRVGARVGQPKN